MFNSIDIKYTMNGVDHVAPIQVFETFAGYVFRCYRRESQDVDKATMNFIMGFDHKQMIMSK